MNLTSKEHWEFMEESGAKTFLTAKELWEVARAYFKWCKDNPILIKKKAMSGKETGKEVVIEKIRPYTIVTLCLHCGIVPEYLSDMCKLSNKNNEFYHVATTIVNIVKGQNIEMAMVDEFNPIFTKTILGLDKEEAPQGGITVQIISEEKPLLLANSESQLLEKIKEERANRAKEEE